MEKSLSSPHGIVRGVFFRHARPDRAPESSFHGLSVEFLSRLNYYLNNRINKLLLLKELLLQRKRRIYMKKKIRIMEMPQLIIGHKVLPCINNQGDCTITLYDKFLLMRYLVLCLIISGFILYSLFYRWSEAFFLFSPLVIALYLNPFFRLSKPELLCITENEIIVYSSFFLFHKKREYKTTNTSLHVYQLKKAGKMVYLLKEVSGKHYRQEAFYVRAENHIIESLFQDYHIGVKHYKSRWSALAVEDQK